MVASRVTVNRNRLCSCLLLSPEAGWLASIELVIWFYVAIILLKSIFENIVYA
jgi:hypothetical protein